ncbi:hypothetical protein Clacol_000468 [Clathrus columnatus]|uniref:Cytochrome P450 n=1 Tax=Clathrus columnatus TaxID=1419009 RepID=A0AAV4ZYI3_9AGAM|nr:hypothetical protein Clacol_000468 [Clathrus columnatus]
MASLKSQDKELPLRSLMLLAKEYGPIYQLSLPGRTSVVISSLELADQVCDQKRFHKAVEGPLKEIRHLTKDGLFTAFHDEPNWALAHRILMPAFGPMKIRGMFDSMYDIASQLIAKWDIETPPFIKSMAYYLRESSDRASRPSFVQSYLYRSASARHIFIIKKRKESSEKTDDLLGLMLTAKDPVTGQGLSDENIAANLVTFLIAGHETTSGLLSFTMNFLLHNPTAYAKVREEVDRELGDQPIKIEQVGKLHYIAGKCEARSVLREVLRLTPPATAISMKAFEETVIKSKGKQYIVTPNDTMHVLLPGLHRDPAVYGENADEFEPERMLDDNFEKLPKNAWKPFGNGVRACIGRPLAWQEAIIAVASIFQKFDLVLHNPLYQLELKATLTIKPANFYVHAIPRKRTILPYHPASPIAAQPSGNIPDGASQDGLPLYLAYGSNSGTCKDFAQRVGTQAPIKGFNPSIVTLDSIEANVPTNGPVIIFTASYEGEPADNAGRFVEALRRGREGQFSNVQYVVFGCGHHDWAHTYQKIPILIDDLLEKYGAQRLLERTAADSGGDEFFETVYGKAVDINKEEQDVFSIEFKDNTRPAVLQKEDTSGLGKVILNRHLAENEDSLKIHIEIELPENMTYKAGDYLMILPRNPTQYVQRVLSRFNLIPDQEIEIKSPVQTTLPTNKSISVSEVIAGYVEVSQTATRKNMQGLKRYASEKTLSALVALEEDYKNAVFEKRLSVLDILELYPDISIPFASFLGMLPAMRIRQYSISSSSLWNPQCVSITVSVVDKPASSGLSNRFLGVASNYLANIKPGELIYVGVRSSPQAFHLPAESSKPIVMFAAGSGIAPMRAFMQERAIQVASGQSVGKMILFYGCRAPDQDYLYSTDDLKTWEDLGILEIKPAFSRAVEHSEGNKYVQDRVWHDRDVITEYYEKGAKFYTCGSPSVANGIKDALLKIIKLRQPSWDDERVARAWEVVQNERLATDVFA